MKDRDEPYCPICGVRVRLGESLVAAEGVTVHRCARRTLAGIDAAHNRNPDEEQVRLQPAWHRQAEWDHLNSQEDDE